MATKTAVLTSSQSWPRPSDWNPSSNKIICIGEGGRGASPGSAGGAGAGGGGACAITNNANPSFPVTATIGTGGTSTNTSFGSVCVAGYGVSGSSVTGGAGGSPITYTTGYAGGNGANGNSLNGGGGGGAAGINGTGANGGAAGGAGGNGGNGGTGDAGTGGAGGAGGTSGPGTAGSPGLEIAGNITFNQSDELNVTLTNGNLTVTGSASAGGVRAAVGANKGKFYSEYTYGSTPIGADTGFGVGTASASLSSLAFNAAGGCIAYANFIGGAIYFNGAAAPGSPVIGICSAGDTICQALDTVNNRIWFRKNNGNWNGSGAADPATNTGGIDISAVFNGVTAFAAAVFNDASNATANFGASAFTYVIPSGFSSYNNQYGSGGGGGGANGTGFTAGAGGNYGAGGGGGSFQGTGGAPTPGLIIVQWDPLPIASQIYPFIAGNPSDDASYWVGTPLDSLVVRIPAAVTFFGAPGQAPTKQWHWDFDDASVWLARPQASALLRTLLTSVGPAKALQWRFGYDDPAFWQGQPVANFLLHPLLTNVGQATSRPWVFNYDETGTWQEQLTSNLQLLLTTLAGGQSPAKQWHWDQDDSAFWIGQPRSSAQLIQQTGYPTNLVGLVQFFLTNKPSIPSALSISPLTIYLNSQGIPQTASWYRVLMNADDPANVALFNNSGLVFAIGNGAVIKSSPLFKQLTWADDIGRLLASWSIPEI